MSERIVGFEEAAKVTSSLFLSYLRAAPLAYILVIVTAIYTKSPGVDVSVMLQTLVRDGMFWMLGCVLAVVLGGFFLLLRVIHESFSL